MAVTRAYIEALIAKLEPELRKAFQRAVEDWRKNADLDGIARALERGDVPTALRAANIQPAALNGVASAAATAFEAGGAAEATGLRLAILFNVRDLRAERFLREASSTLIQEITADQVAMIRTVLTDALARGQGGRATALDLVGRQVNGVRSGGFIGLTETQAKWALNLQAKLQGDPAALLKEFEAGGYKLRDQRLDGIVRRAVKADKPIAAADIQKIVTAYRNRALRFRGEGIARTETLRAVNSGRHEAFQQAIDSGKIAEQNVRRVWNSAHDKRVRDTHRAMDGQSVGMADSFISPSGARLRYPCDERAPLAETVNCRCNVSYRVDHLANIR